MSVAKLAMACALALAGCAAGEEQRAPQHSATQHSATQHSAAVVGGEDLFNSYCAACHGVRAVGTEQGPPLAHPIYEPGHHGDAAFFMAVQFGVKQHHWEFGDMPKQPQVTEDEVRQIVAYVRAVQREAGIE